MDTQTVYVLVDVDSEYGRRSLVAVYNSEESASAARAHLSINTSASAWSELAQQVFGVHGNLIFEDLQIDEAKVIDPASLALAWVDARARASLG